MSGKGTGERSRSPPVSGRGVKGEPGQAARSLRFFYPGEDYVTSKIGSIYSPLRASVATFLIVFVLGISTILNLDVLVDTLTQWRASVGVGNPSPGTMDGWSRAAA